MTREEAINILTTRDNQGNPVTWQKGFSEAYDLAVEALKEQKTGKWIALDECANKGVYCGECRKKVFKFDYSNTMKWKNFRYCPNCGARMGGDVG